MKTGISPLSLTVRDVCFLHWPVSKARAQTLVPDWLTVDTTDGSAWISALPLEIAAFDVGGLPVREDVHAVILRTYVRSAGGDRGIYFLAIDADDRPAVETARRLFGLPTHVGRIDQSTDGDRRTVRATRQDEPGATLDVSYEPSGPTRSAAPDTLASFLIERYRYFTDGPLGTRLVGSVGHEPWSLRSANATVSDHGLVATVGLPRNLDQPLAHYNRRSTMQFSPPKPLTLAE